MVKLIHAADFHLDSPFAGLSPELAAQRRGEQRRLIQSLAQLAREREADGVLLAGDLLDGRRTFRETVEELSRQLGSIPCPVFIAPGNHDFYEGRSPYATVAWPENVHIFREDRVERVELPGKNCAIYGAAFTAPHAQRSPLAGFSAPGGEVSVMVLHGAVEDGGDYGPIAREDIARSGLSYLALGHVHQFSGLQKEGNTFWAYPGCPEGRGFDELGEKGVLYLEVEEGACRCSFVPLGKRRYQILSVDLTGAASPLAAVRAALPGGTGEDVYRILLTGESPCPPDLRGLERELAGEFFGLTLRDHTRPPRAVWSRMEEDTLTGLFLQEMARRCAQRPDDDILQLAVRFGMAALEGGEDVAP